MTTVGRKSIRRRVIRDAIIPERDIASLPLEAGVELWARGDDLVEQSDDVVGFCLGDADDLGHEARVEEDTLPACDGVGAHERVLCRDGLASDGAAEVA